MICTSEIAWVYMLDKAVECHFQSGLALPQNLQLIQIFFCPILWWSTGHAVQLVLRNTNCANLYVKCGSKNEILLDSTIASQVEAHYVCT